MKKPYALWIILMLPVALPGWSQWTFGLSGSYTLPSGQRFSAVNREYASATLSLLNRQFCHWWYGVRFDYGFLQRKPNLDSLTVSYQNAAILSGELRWFPWLPTDIPFYVAGNLSFSDVGHTPRSVRFSQQSATEDEPSPSGIGFGIGIGYLLFYSSHCCDWFLDVSIRYHSYNGIWRSDTRPHLSGFGLHFGGFVKL